MASFVTPPKLNDTNILITMILFFNITCINDYFYNINVIFYTIFLVYKYNYYLFLFTNAIRTSNMLLSVFISILPLYSSTLFFTLSRPYP